MVYCDQRKHRTELSSTPPARSYKGSQEQERPERRKRHAVQRLGEIAALVEIAHVSGVHVSGVHGAPPAGDGAGERRRRGRRLALSEVALLLLLRGRHQVL